MQTLSRELENRARIATGAFARLRSEQREIDADYLILLIAKSGSAPQSVGAYLLLNHLSRETRGTIGGGRIEYRASALACELAKRGLSARLRYTLDNHKASDLGMICGGENELVFLPIHPESPLFADDSLESQDSAACLATTFRALALDRPAAPLDWRSHPDYSEALEDFAQETKFFEVYSEPYEFLPMAELAAQLTSDVDFTEALSAAQGSLLLETKRGSYFFVTTNLLPRLIICGGGHVAQAISKLLDGLEWPHWILEDRADFLNPALFSSLAKLQLVNFAELEADFSFEAQDFVLVMTRGHQYDYDVVTQLLKQMPAYVGVMGSRRKVESVRRMLAEAGFDADLIDSLHAPVGINIGAVSLVEIAHSVIAELIAVRRAVAPERQRPMRDLLNRS
ncbi:MAG: XdhC family protein [Eubacteriales bacterium]|nr:XdhC family protein [Eubacteriales bacterium]